MTAQSKRTVDRKRKQEIAKYLQKHRDVLERINQHCINRILHERPPDPYAALLDKLSEHTRTGVKFHRFHAIPNGGESIRCEVCALVRGAEVISHSSDFPLALVSHGFASTAEGDAADDAGIPVGAAAALFGATLTDALHGIEVTDFDALHTALCNALGGSPCPSAKDRGSSKIALRCATEDFVLTAAGRLCGGSVASALRWTFSQTGQPLAEPLNSQQDFPSWRNLWPQILEVAASTETTEEGCACRHFFVGANIWAATVEEVPGLTGMAPEFIDPTARESRAAAAARGHVPDKDDPHDPDEHCPPLNGIPIAAACASLLAEKVVAEAGALKEDDDFMNMTNTFRQVLSDAFPSQVASDVLTNSPRASIFSSNQRNSALYCGFDFRADTAYNEESGLYKWSEEQEARSSEQLVDFYCDLCNGEPLLKMILNPFSPRDPVFTVSMENLSRLVTRIVLVTHIWKNRVNEGEDDRGNGDSALDGVCGNFGLGYPAEFGACGLLARHQEKPEAVSERQYHAVYDFTKEISCLDVGGAYIGASMVLPESSRRFLLPRSTSIQNAKDRVEPFSRYFRRQLISSFAVASQADALSPDRVCRQQFQDGLSGLGFTEAESYAHIIYDFVNMHGANQISEHDLTELDNTRGLAALRQIDEFRRWILKDSGKEALEMLTQRMDTSGTGSITQKAFSKALQQLKHPLSKDGALPIRELFLCFDLEVGGTIPCRTFARFLHVFGARQQLKCVRNVQSFLIDRFGSLKGAWKATDEERQGTISTDAWVEKMRLTFKYVEASDLESCVQLLVKHSGLFTAQVFDLVGKFSDDAFWRELLSFRVALEDTHGSLEEAYETFSCHGGSHLTAKMFADGCRSLNFEFSWPPQIAFNLLDIWNKGKVDRDDFLLLESLDVIERLEQRSEKLSAASNSIKEFLVAWAENHDGEVSSAERWVALHLAIRESTLDEVY